MTTASTGLEPRIYRRDRDSSIFAKPRVFARTFCDPSDLVRTVRFYEDLSGEAFDQDIDLPALGIRIVAVGSFLILVLDKTRLGENRFEQASRTTTTVILPSLDEGLGALLGRGAERIGERFTVPHGAGQRMRNPDGLIVEYLEHRPSPYDVQEPDGSLRT